MGVTAGNFFTTDRIIIGYDHRPQALILRQELVRGIIETGNEAINIGTVPTSALLIEYRRFQAPTIMITGSHPPRYYRTPHIQERYLRTKLVKKANRG